MKKRSLTVLVSIAALSAILLAACAPAAGISEDRGLIQPDAIGAPSFEAPEAGFASELDAGGGVVANDAVVAQAAERLVIKNASVSIVVDDPEQRMGEIAAMAEAMGGFVVSSNIYKTSLSDGTEVPQAYITIRVPERSFVDAMDEIKAGAFDVPNDNWSGQDVTSEYTDLQSRLRNLEDAAESVPVVPPVLLVADPPVELRVVHLPRHPAIEHLLVPPVDHLHGEDRAAGARRYVAEKT